MPFTFVDIETARSRRIVLLFPPIPLPSRVFVAAYGIIELALSVTGTASGVAHFAHLGGMLGGGLLLHRWRRLAARYDEV